MKLANASRYFDDTPALDGYSARHLFYAQPGSFESSNPEGSVAKRRVLSVAPGISMPARRALDLLGEKWIVGSGSQDSLRGRSLRQSYWMRKSTGLYTIQTPAQACLNLGDGTQAYALREYLKDTSNPLNDASYDPQYLVSFAIAEPVSKGAILRLDAELLHVRSVYIDLAEFRVAVADDISGSAVTATFTTSTYVPATDTYTSISTAVPALLIERSKLFEQQTPADAPARAGDQMMLVAQTSLTPTVGQQVTAGSDWRVTQVTGHLDSWLLHLEKF